MRYSLSLYPRAAPIVWHEGQNPTYCEYANTKISSRWTQKEYSSADQDVDLMKREVGGFWYSHWGLPSFQDWDYPRVVYELYDKRALILIVKVKPL